VPKTVEEGPTSDTTSTAQAVAPMSKIPESPQQLTQSGNDQLSGAGSVGEKKERRTEPLPEQAVVSNDNRSALYRAARDGDVALVQRLLDGLFSRPLEVLYALKDACKADDTAALRLVIQEIKTKGGDYDSVYRQVMWHALCCTHTWTQYV
jgi:hypothetical protein